MKYPYTFLAIAFAAFLSACAGKKEKASVTPESGAIPVRTIEIHTHEEQTPVTLSGKLTTDDETILSFKTGGVIEHVYVREGDAIRRGQLLATLHLTEVKAQVQQASLGLEKAQRDFERATRLYRDSVATLEQFQNAQTGLALAQQQESAARFNLQYSEIRASADGYVLKKFANSGQVVGPGTPVLLTNGAGQSQWLLRTGASDAEWAALSLRDKAIVTMDAFPGVKLEGWVSRKAESADAGTGTFMIELTLTNTGGRKLASGMFGQATVVPSRTTAQWRIPYDALMDGDQGNGYVFVTDDQKTVRKVPVSIADIGQKDVQITAGLEQARWLIVSGSAYLTDGALIRIVQP